MAKIEFRKGMDVRRFVRVGEQAEIGPPNTGHEEIARQMGLGSTREEIARNIAEHPEDKDMGYLMRTRGKVSVFDRSSNFKFPPVESLRQERDKTVIILRKKYDGEDFEPDYDIDK